MIPLGLCTLINTDGLPSLPFMNTWKVTCIEYLESDMYFLCIVFLLLVNQKLKLDMIKLEQVQKKGLLWK